MHPQHGTGTSCGVGPYAALNVEQTVHRYVPHRVCHPYCDDMDPLAAMISPLFLVYPPVSNRVAIWVTEDPDVEKTLRSSALYMIATRAEATFTPPTDHNGVLSLELTTGDTLTDGFELDCVTLAKNAEIDCAPDDIIATWDPKFIALYANASADDIESGRAEMFEWFTADKLIYDVGRRKPGITGLTRHREFATYRLLYVGIAKNTDTYERLFAGAHAKRQKILGSEDPIRAGSQITDEMFLFAWAADPLVAREIETPEDYFDTHNQDWVAHYRAVIADAEKAFVSLLKPQYNEVQFTKYPKGADGLYDYRYNGHSFAIAENYTFQGPTVSMYGSWSGFEHMAGNDADAICIKGDSVTLYQDPTHHTTDKAATPDAHTGD